MYIYSFSFPIGNVRKGENSDAIRNGDFDKGNKKLTFTTYSEWTYVGTVHDDKSVNGTATKQGIPESTFRMTYEGD